MMCDFNFSCLFLESWLFFLKKEEFPLTAPFFSPIAWKKNEVSITILFSVCLSLCLYLPLTRISLLSIHFYPPPPPFLPLFLLSFSHSSLTLSFTPSPITVKLQGGWLGTFLTEKFGSDQNHEQAFLHSFPNLNDFAASQAHPPRQPDTLTLTLWKSPALSFSCAHAQSFIFLSLSLSHIYKHTHAKQNSGLKVVVVLARCQQAGAHIVASLTSVSWENRWEIKEEKLQLWEEKAIGKQIDGVTVQQSA